MGWAIYELTTDDRLLTRGGFEGLHLESQGRSIAIPESLLWRLALEAIRQAKLTMIEEATGAELLDVAGTPLGEKITRFENQPEGS